MIQSRPLPDCAAERISSSARDRSSGLNNPIMPGAIAGLNHRHGNRAGIDKSVDGSAGTRRIDSGHSEGNEPLEQGDA